MGFGFGFNSYCVEAVIDLSRLIGNERLRYHYAKLPRYRLCIQSRWIADVRPGFTAAVKCVNLLLQ